MERRNCIVCGSSRIKGLGKAAHRNLGKCLDCGLVFAVEYDSNKLREIYEANYYSRDNEAEIVAWIEANRKIWRGLVKDLLAVKGEVGKLLDIGSGTGGFLQEFAALMPATELHAVESSEFAAASQLKRIPGLKLSLSLDENRDCDYDAICLLQALEHFDDPQAVLETAHTKLAAGGALLLTVPNRRSLGCFLKGRAEPLCYGNETHLQFFCKADIERLLQRAGFSRVSRVKRFGFGNASLVKSVFQYLARLLGISSELRYLAFK